MNIFLAEDNPADVLIVREVLRQHAFKHQLHVISDGERALDLINQWDSDESLPCPDIFLIDLHLPKQDGHEVLARLKASRRCAKTPVVIFSSEDPVTRQLVPIDTGVTYFPKSLQIDDYFELGNVIKALTGVAHSS